MEKASLAFERWQINSLLLAAAFLPWSYYDWAHIHRILSGVHGDLAIYLFLGVSDHMTWMVSWALLSANVVDAFRVWRKAKIGLLRKLSFRCEVAAEFTPAPEVEMASAQASELLKAVLEKSPVSYMQLLIVSVAGGVAVLWPVIQLLRPQ